MSKTLCHQYLTALNEGDLNKVLSLFDEGASVSSPLYGRMPAAHFYRALFADTNRSETTFIRWFESEDKKAIALQFEYRWTLKNGKTVRFECVDVFELTAKKDRFASLTILYDTAPIRSDVEAGEKE